MLTRAHLILLVVTIAAPAHAKLVDHAAPAQEATPAIVVGAPDDPLVSITRTLTDMHEVGETAVITLTLELGCPNNFFDTGRMTMTLPRDAAIVGMTFARNGERLTAVARDAIDAQKTFDQARVVKRDPALLEWTDASQVRLSLYPLMAGEHPTATVTITVPRFRRLIVDVAGAQRELIGGTFAPSSAGEIAAVQREPGVTSGVSLLAMPPPSLDDIDVHVGNSQAEIRSCASLADADEPRDITLIVVIGADGHVAKASAGDSPAGACAARLASTWRFGPDERPIAMHYRLHLTRG